MSSTKHVSRSVYVCNEFLVSLMRRSFQIISVALGAALLSGCASLPETSRSASSVSVPQPGSITALQRQFQAQVPFHVNFGFDQDTLDAEAIARLDRQAEWIIDHPNVKFRVFGHTDRVGNVDYNADLGLRRAQRVVDYLVSKGVEEERLEAMLSFGEENPLIDTEARERLNRRAETEVHEYIVPPTNTSDGGNAFFALFSGPRSTPTPLGNSSSDPTPTSVTSTAPDSPSDDTGSNNTGSDNTGSDNTGSSDTSSSDSSSSGSPSGSSSSSDTSSGDTSSGSSSDTSSSGDDTSSNGGGSKANSGRGNGDEQGDPGKSSGKNNGGDEV